MSVVRTTIEIEDTYVRAIMDRYGVPTKTAAVDLALRHLAGQPMTREEALAMQRAHAISELPPDLAADETVPHAPSSAAAHNDLDWFIDTTKDGREHEAAQAWLDTLPALGEAGR